MNKKHETRAVEVVKLRPIVLWSLCLIAAGALAEGPNGPTATSASPSLESYRDLIFSVADQYESNEFRIDSLVESLDFDYENAFYFVRDEIRLHPYDGVLRGRQGVLAVRAGNSLERAILLANLIEDMGSDARLAFGSISAERQLELDERTVSDEEGIDFAALASVVGLGPDVQQKMWQRAEHDYAQIAPLALPILVANVQEPNQSRALHVWVQTELGGKWIDLDPAFPDAEPGDVYGAVSTYSTKLDSQARHKVSIRVIAETLAEGQLAESTLLEQTVDASIAAREQILLWFVPQPAPAAAMKLRNLVAPGDGFVPVIAVDGKAVTGQATPPVTTTLSMPSAAESFFSAGKDDALSGIYLEITVHQPNQPPVTKRRILLDRLLPAQRRKPSKQANLLPLEVGYRQPTVFEAIHQIGIVTGGVGPFELASTMGVSMAFANEHFRDQSKFSELTLIDSWWPIGNINLAWLNTGEQVVLDKLNSSDGSFYFVGRPQVAVMSVFPVAIDDQFVLASEIDFLHDDISVVARPESESASTKVGKVRYGLLRSALETELGVAKAKYLDIQGGELISASLRLSPPLNVVKRSSDTYGVAPAQLARDVDAGAIVIVSEGSSIETWWTIDPSSGNTSARLAPGLGGTRIMGRKIYHAGGNFGGSSGARTYVIDPKTMNVIEEYDANNRRVRKSMNKPNKHKRKSGSTEYLTVLEYISIPVGWHVGVSQGMFVTEIFIVVLLNVNTMDHY